MNPTKRAEAHLRNAKRFALAYANNRAFPPSWMTNEQKDAWWIVNEAMQNRRKDQALSSIIDWAYAEGERLNAVKEKL